MSSSSTETGRLIRRAIEGSESATDQLLSRYRSQLKRMVAIRMDPRLKARFDPSDVVQSVLAEAALPTGRIAQALLGFNLGVEVGQLIAVACVWPLIWWVFQRRSEWRVAFVQLCSTPVFAAGLYWFLTRSFG